jgi:hypothetical protein
MTFYPTEMPILLRLNHKDLWQTLCVLSVIINFNIGKEQS